MNNYFLPKTKPFFRPMQSSNNLLTNNYIYLHLIHPVSCPDIFFTFPPAFITETIQNYFKINTGHPPSET